MKNRRAVLAALVVVFAGVVAANADAIARFSAEGLTMAAARASGSSERVVAAQQRLKDALPALFVDKGVAWPPHEVFLRAMKENDDGGPGAVELWARDEKQARMTLIKSYPICAKSGIKGPKRRQGDLQVPEGIYTISQLNPLSSYHLSMRVDYPNASDKIRGRKIPGNSDLGGDIMVHGDCVTIGCIPLENEPIEEVWLAVDAVFGKRPVRIHIFPRRLDAQGLESLLATTTDPALRAFWTELAAGWRKFDESGVVPDVVVGKDGAYVVK